MHEDKFRVGGFGKNYDEIFRNKKNNRKRDNKLKSKENKSPTTLRGFNNTYSLLGESHQLVN